MQTIQAYAAPCMFGPWVTAGSHGGKVHYSIKAKAEGNTLVLGEVRYWSSERTQSVQGFKESIDVTTGNVWGIVQVHFKGIPLGSAVRVTVR